MEGHIIETRYPLTFREEEAGRLGALLSNRRSVVLVGMKRVGISNFLRFFLYHKDIPQTYLKGDNHFFVPVDLNDLVERELFPFWVLTLKRIADSVEASTLPDKVKKKVSSYFLDSIQSQDLFFTIDCVRKSLSSLAEEGYLPTVFYLRFDRLEEAISPELFANFQGLVDAAHGKLSFVFTSDRALKSVSVFADTFYIKPAKHTDTQIVFDTNIKTRPLKLGEEETKNLLGLVDGYIQYLQFALISLHEVDKIPATKDELFEFLLKDERIALQSEELWESLTDREQKALLEIGSGKAIKDFPETEYLWSTGIVGEDDKLFSSLFEEYIRTKGSRRETVSVDLTKKELALLNFLEANKDQVCEREQIIENVWPEAEELGVTDWAIDRLEARVREKLKNQNSKKEIVTVKTRGYKLTEGKS